MNLINPFNLPEIPRYNVFSCLDVTELSKCKGINKEFFNFVSQGYFWKKYLPHVNPDEVCTVITTNPIKATQLTQVLKNFINKINYKKENGQLRCSFPFMPGGELILSLGLNNNKQTFDIVENYSLVSEIGTEQGTIHSSLGNSCGDSQFFDLKIKRNPEFIFNMQDIYSVWKDRVRMLESRERKINLIASLILASFWVPFSFYLNKT